MQDILRQMNLVFKWIVIFFLLACAEGGNKTDISGQLVFTRGARPHEIECEWSIHNSNGDHVILNFERYREHHCG